MFSSLVRFQNKIVFKFPKSFFFPFWEIPKRIEDEFCSRFKIQNAKKNERFQKRCPSSLAAIGAGGGFLSEQNARFPFSMKMGIKFFLNFFI